MKKSKVVIWSVTAAVGIFLLVGYLTWPMFLLIPLSALSDASCASSSEWDGVTLPLPNESISIKMRSGDSFSTGCLNSGQTKDGQLAVDGGPTSVIDTEGSTKWIVAPFVLVDNGCYGRAADCKPVGDAMYLGLFSKNSGPMVYHSSLSFDQSRGTVISNEVTSNGTVKVVYYSETPGQSEKYYVEVKKEADKLVKVSQGKQE